MPSYLLPADHPAVDVLSAIVTSVIGRTPARRCYQAGTDGTYLWNEFGIPVLGCGPGKIELAHTPREHIRVQDLLQAREIYARLIQALGQGAER